MKFFVEGKREEKEKISSSCIFPPHEWLLFPRQRAYPKCWVQISAGFSNLNGEQRDKGGSRWAKLSPRTTSGGHDHQPQPSPAAPCPPWEEPQATSCFQVGRKELTAGTFCSKSLTCCESAKPSPPFEARKACVWLAPAAEQPVLLHRPVGLPLVLAPRFNFDQ